MQFILVVHVAVSYPLYFTLDHFRHSWQATVISLWDLIPASILLQGDSKGWRTVLKDIQKLVILC